MSAPPFLLLVSWIERSAPLLDNHRQGLSPYLLRTYQTQLIWRHQSLCLIQTDALSARYLAIVDRTQFPSPKSLESRITSITVDSAADFFLSVAYSLSMPYGISVSIFVGLQSIQLFTHGTVFSYYTMFNFNRNTGK